MKEDARPGPDGGPERDTLRETLRHWKAPAAPAELESALRREFRNRRPRRQRAVWLSLAAVLGLLAAWLVIAPRLRGRPAAAPAHSASGTDPEAASPAAPEAPLAPRPPQLEPLTATARAVVPEARPGATRALEPRKPRVPTVVVERGQADLLPEFARRAWERTEAGLGASLPSVAAGQAPSYRSEWKEVAGEWPAVQIAVSTSGR